MTDPDKLAKYRADTAAHDLNMEAAYRAAKAFEEAVNKARISGREIDSTVLVGIELNTSSDYKGLFWVQLSEKRNRYYG